MTQECKCGRACRLRTPHDTRFDVARRSTKTRTPYADLHGAGFSAPDRRNPATVAADAVESQQKGPVSTRCVSRLSGAHLAPGAGEPCRVSSSSRFDRAHTHVRTERRVAVQRVVSSAAGRTQCLRATGPDDVYRRDPKRALPSTPGRTDGVSPRRCTPGSVRFARATRHRCRSVPIHASIDLVRATS